jgi:hypothetical protein
MIRRAVTIIGIAVVGLLIFGVAACGSSRYSPEIRESYFSACPESSMTRADCECTLEFLEESISEDEFIAASKKMAAGQEPSDEFIMVLAEAAMTCALKSLR